jgi:methyl-accepting chemotaxis protein
MQWDLPVLGQRFVMNFVPWVLILGIAVLLVRFIWRRVTRSRTVLFKLIFAAVPVMMLALAAFGAVSYTSYTDALSDTYQSKTADEGNLLRALFDGAGFDRITSPEQYGSTDYQYMVAQLSSRSVYTSSGYYVGGRLFTGTSANTPPLFPFGADGSTEAARLYKQAALTGQQQTGTVSDGWGSRVVCVTPVGSSSGEMVFLVETGVFDTQIADESQGFLFRYLLIALVCIVGATILMIIAFSRAVRPLRQLLPTLERFATGQRQARVEVETNDEIADVGRVFNKMANEIETQIYDLQSMSDLYYHFVPQKMLSLLNLNSLNDIALGQAA